MRAGSVDRVCSIFEAALFCVASWCLADARSHIAGPRGSRVEQTPAPPKRACEEADDVRRRYRRDNSETLFATPEIVADRRADGSIWLKSTDAAAAGARCVGDWLEHWARQTPERIFLGERSDAEAPWTTVTYKDALRQVRSVAAWILAQGLSAERPLVILSDNSVDHALFALAAMHVGVPTAAISPAYSLMSKDFDKLKSMIGLLDPGAIYVSGTKPFASALAAIRPLHSASDRQRR